jgi:UDP-N-acetylglucosamine 4,6-dehydratase (inverting)
MFDKKTILITGGTGSFGHAFVGMLLKRFNPREIIVFSRDEMKQWNMAKLWQGDERVRFVIGDVRDQDALRFALRGVDYVVHAAATKIVPTAEYNPLECVKTNIDGAKNVIDAAFYNNVKRVVALSTDKASNPINLYGATKLVSDKLFVAANKIGHGDQTQFSVVRYGNVMGSRGSIIPYFLELVEAGATVLPITDVRMSRFMISLGDAVELVWNAFADMVGGEIYVKKIPSMSVVDIARAIAPQATHKIIGIRDGEKIHEQMISREDALTTFEYDGHFKILPTINNFSKDPNRIKSGVAVDPDFIYESSSNPEWMSREELTEWINQNRGDVGRI